MIYLRQRIWEFISNASNGVIEAKRPILDRQCTRLYAYVTANFKCVFLRLKLSTLGMFSVDLLYVRYVHILHRWKD